MSKLHTFLLACVVAVFAFGASADGQARPATPVAATFNQTAPGTSTDIFASDLEPSRRYSEQPAWRLTVALTTASTFAVVADDGSTTHVWLLNGGTALAAGTLYTFSLGVDPDLNYNFHVVSADGVIELLLVEEIVDGVL